MLLMLEFLALALALAHFGFSTFKMLWVLV